MLMPPIAIQPLILYDFLTLVTLGALLPQCDEHGKERAIYYISRTIVGHVINYKLIEQIYLVVCFSAQKLRHYILIHKRKLMFKIGPLKYILSKVDLLQEEEQNG